MSQTNLVFVDIGIKCGAHISPRGRSYIELADLVFVLVPDNITEEFIGQMNANVRSLMSCFQQGRSHLLSCQEIVATILTEVKIGKKVVIAFSDHPRTLPWISHNAVKKALKLGFKAHVEPGVSAKGCLYADLGIDPLSTGCKHLDIKQLLFYKREIDTTSLLVLWQKSILGDINFAKLITDIEYRKVLVRLLVQYYPIEHEIILYEADTLSNKQPRTDYMPISALPNVVMDLKTILVIPPSAKAELKDRSFLAGI
ncbi:SAM-dependent methyltransferase [Rheinheimera sp.]|uniref:SAM-dependent methyltransferase n=1 Tax=Rheinheimera sp. TaxID=1869214 RepID=UPI0037C81536